MINQDNQIKEIPSDNKKYVDDIYLAILDYIYGRIGIDVLHSKIYTYMTLEESIRQELSTYITEKILPVVKVCEGDVFFYYICSFLIEASRKAEVCNCFLEATIKDDSLTKIEKYYLYGYVKGLRFLKKCEFEESTEELLDLLYNTVLDAYSKDISIQHEFIRKDLRDENFVLVLISQFLSMNHGPTKTVLDRCYILSKYMNKSVFLINTAEMCSAEPAKLLYKQTTGNYLEDLSEIGSVEYKDCVIPFRQAIREMPNSNVIKEILRFVQMKKPYCIVTIGGGSIVSDLCSKIVPTITISTVPSDKAQTYGQFQAIGKRIDESDLKWASKHGLTKNHFIESIFTSAFKEQTHKYCRRDFNLPENGFIGVLIGGRLDTEIDEGCIELLRKLMRKGLFVAFVGRFNRYSSLVEKDDLFRQYSIDLGTQEDVLALLECFDFYINPKRVGGGTSVAEALYKKVPVVTMNYGDGGLGAGCDFCVDSYEAMYDRIIELYEDRDYYHHMQLLAEKRAEILMDSKGQFVKILETAFERADFL